MGFDRVHAHDETAGNLLVRQPTDRQVDYLALARRQLPVSGGSTAADSSEFLACPRGPTNRTAPIEHRGGLLRGPARSRTFPESSLEAAEKQKSSTLVEVQPQSPVLGGGRVHRLRCFVDVAFGQVHASGAALG